MRPIHLSIAGLHSFREKQDIDFQFLCQRGVFGIFGPTGSGKSSILDAMTLALYGKVERASNNTQGIMNHAEHEINVSFTFELDQAHGIETYRVERQFKRAGDVSVRTATCRLLRLSPGTTAGNSETVVLADKANDVQDKLYQLIGLTIDDFTRAVVLPQGKFAEFLSLKGVERRQMLQRLFHLEKYGDQLSLAIRERVNKAETRRKTLEAEQQGLGDASAEKLAEVSKLLDQCEDQLHRTNQEWNQLKEEHEQQKEVWQLQQEQLSVQEEIRRLREQENDIERLERQLKLLKEAQRLLPYATERSTGEQELKRWLTQEQNLSEKLLKAKAAAEQAEKAYREVWQANEQAIPQWLEKQSQLKQALEWQEELKRVVREADDLKQQAKRTAEKEKELAQTVEQLRNLLQKARHRQQEIKTKLKTNVLSTALKRELRQAYQAFLQLQEEKRRAAEVEHAFRQQGDDLQTLRERVTHADAERQKQEKQLQHLLEQWQACFVTYGQAQQEALNVLKEGYTCLHGLEQALERSKERHYAAQLAGRLRPGEPCPVCGSKEHPLPLGAGSETAEETEEMKRRQTYEQFKISVETFKEQLQSKEKLLQQAEQAYRTLSETIEQEHALEEALVEQIASALDSVQSSNLSSGAYRPDQFASSGSSEIDSEHLRQWNYGATAQLDVFQSLADRVQRLLTEQQRWRKNYQQVLNGWRETRSLYEANEQYVLTERQKMLKLKEQIEQREKNWQMTYSSFSLETVEAQYRAWEEREKDLEDLRQRLEKSEEFIAQQQQELEQQQAHNTRLHVETAERNARYEQIRQYIDSLKNKLNVFGEDPLQQLKRLDKLLEDSKQREASLKNSMEQMKEQYGQVEKALAVAQESLKQAEARLHRAQLQWEEQAAESPFETPDQVLTTVVEKPDYQQWEARIEAYRRDCNRWNQEQMRLTERLGDRAIKQEEWEQLQSRLHTIEQQYNALLEEKGALAREKSAIEQRWFRYQQLEQQKQEVETELERLGKLSSVFRGNSFVEYLAEEHLIRVCRDASVRLGALTRQRYALEIDSQGGFLIRDDANGGVKRPVSTLSGGETFLASLSLALALSAQIQLRGKYPLSFFFLDEGFGTLDQTLLDTVVTSLEQLQTDHLSIGVISHVPELRERLPRKLIIKPAEPGGVGSRVFLESL